MGLGLELQEHALEFSHNAEESEEVQNIYCLAFGSVIINEILILVTATNYKWQLFL